ncbi:MAG: hypothetical protein JWO70_1573, partial [Betaproteobacteria bacterium]|nr:hypothetical protein [Betaproteobacteria bacterium]
RKFTVNCEAIIGTENAERLMEVVWEFDEQRDVRELVGLIGGGFSSAARSAGASPAACKRGGKAWQE